MVHLTIAITKGYETSATMNAIFFFFICFKVQQFCLLTPSVSTFQLLHHYQTSIAFAINFAAFVRLPLWILRGFVSGPSTFQTKPFHSSLFKSCPCDMSECSSIDIPREGWRRYVFIFLFFFFFFFTIM